MPVSRDGTGPAAGARALASQVHPVFMLPPVATALFGGALAGLQSVSLAALHATAVFAAVYTAHVKDGYVDFHGRGEDDDHPLTVRGCRLGLALATTLYAATFAALWLGAGPIGALLTVPGWVVGYLHAPHLDTNPVGATAGYPFGIALSLVGGYWVQAGGVSTVVLALGGVFLVVLSGIKAVDDATDYEYDRSIDKRTLAVVLGPARTHRVAYGLMAFGMVAVVALAVALPTMPTGAALAPAAFAVVVPFAYRAEPELATMLLVRGSYLFLAVLVVAAGFRPLG